MAVNGAVSGENRALAVEIRPQCERTDDPVRVRAFWSAVRQWLQLAYQYSLEHPEDLTPSPDLTQCSQYFALGVDGVLLDGRELCDACAGVTRQTPGGYVIEIHDTPLAEAE